MKIIYTKTIISIILLFTILLISISGCTNTGEPGEDLTIKFYWDTGTLSPEYYYYYRITIGPGLKGIFEYQPGYGEPPAPDVWNVDFDVSQGQIDQLYRLIIDNNLLKEQWEKTDEIAEGGSYSSMKIILDSRDYNIPAESELKREDIKKTSEVSDYLIEMVPSYIWEEMESRQNQFQESFTYE
jgi:hypothetical protein